MMKVYCHSCNEHVYNYVGPQDMSAQKILGEHFEPANKDISRPVNGELIRCPKCKEPVFEYNLATKKFRMKTDFGVKP